MSYHTLPCRILEGVTRGEYVILRTNLADHYCWVCPYCSRALPAPNGQWDRLQATVDHLVPRGEGGGDEWDNLVPACLSCNSSKADKPLLIFLLQRRWPVQKMTASRMPEHVSPPPACRVIWQGARSYLPPSLPYGT